MHTFSQMHLSSLHTKYEFNIIFILVLLFLHEFHTLDTIYDYTDYAPHFNPAEMNTGYNEDYWIGPIPQDYIEVNEKTAKRLDFNPAEFKRNRKNNKVSVIQHLDYASGIAFCKYFVGMLSIIRTYFYFTSYLEIK